MANPECIWLNRRFRIRRASSEARWPAGGGLYVFAGKVRSPGATSQWRAVYVGKCRDFDTRLPSHDRWPEAERHGATHVHLLVVHSPAERDRLEEQLIRKYQPLLNDQHR